jgi:hypothetical protein
LLASSQGESTVVAYTREGSNIFVGEFSVGSSGTIDAVSGSDGLDVTNFPLGSGFGSGLFAIHDSSNSGATASNVKYVPWASIAAALGLAVDTTWDPRLVGLGSSSPPPPAPPLPPAGTPVNAFLGRYYDNEDLTNLRLERIDSGINFNWASGSPDASVVSDTFSVRWEGYWDFAQGGIYNFTITTDDGMRVWIDNASVLDTWIPQSPTSYAQEVEILSGRHDIRVEYFERTGGAVAQVAWAYSAPLPGGATWMFDFVSPLVLLIGGALAAAGVAGGLLLRRRRAQESRT